MQKVKDAALRKMAVAFKNHKNREWDKYVKGGRKTPVFEGTLENQRAHWDDFVKFKDSELAKEQSRINKKNAEKRISSISWGQVAMRWQCLSGISLRKRWRMQVPLRLLRAGPPGSGLGSMRMGGELDPKTGNVSTRASLKGADDAILVSIEEARSGVFQPNRENDELTRALGNPEHPGRTRGKGDIPWYEGFSDWNTDYRSYARKKQEEEQKRKLEEER